MTLPTRTPSQVLLPASTNGVILAAIIVIALYFGSSVFIPLSLAVLLSFVLNPLVVMLRSVRVPRALAIGLVIACFVAAIGLLATVMARQVTELGNDLPRYEQTLRQKLKMLRTGTAQTGLVDRATATLKQLGKELDQNPSAPAANTPAVASSGDLPKPIPVEIHQPPERPLDTYQRIVKVLLAPLTTTGIVLILMIFILMQREDIRDRVIRLVGARDIELTTAALNDAAFRLSRLFLAQTAINVGYGAIIALGLWIIGVPNPMLWGIIATLMRFIPYIGAIFAAVFPVLLAAAVDPGWSMVIWTLALYAIMEPAVGHFIEPWIQSKTTGLSPLAVVVSAVLWTALWGPIGLLLATPLTMCLVVLGRHVEGLAFLDVILGDQPALSPPEIFYQRLLAGSSAEAADQADQLLKSTTLTNYYDIVALAGLKIASADAHRGAIDEQRMTELHAGVVVLLDDLSDHPLEPPQEKNQATEATAEQVELLTTLPVLQEADLPLDWRSETGAVLCLGAQTPLDEAAAEILAQLIRRHGVAARVSTSARLAELGRLDLAGVKVIWISSIAASQSQAHIRFVVRRLRRRLPDVIVCGGFWDGDENAALVEGITRDRQAHDLTTAVGITMALARNDNATSDDVVGTDQIIAIRPTEIHSSKQRPAA